MELSESRMKDVERLLSKIYRMASEAHVNGKPNARVIISLTRLLCFMLKTQQTLEDQTMNLKAHRKSDILHLLSRIESSADFLRHRSQSGDVHSTGEPWKEITAAARVISALIQAPEIDLRLGGEDGTY